MKTNRQLTAAYTHCCRALQVHNQGIIHRDIKPANLLWSEDRRTVKITDFGVSHFSYAQRLAAAGKRTLPSDDTEPILMDDSDLSKTAGTPSFLAPEIISDSTTDMSSSTSMTTSTSVPASASASASTSTLHLTAAQRKKPSITKAIDIWALGVTLYCLLFGRLPFQAATEYEIYRVIRTQDWDVHETMGSDCIPVGPRRYEPKKLSAKGHESEGYLVVHLLERFLEKNAAKRITLDQVKVRLHEIILHRRSSSTFRL